MAWAFSEMLVDYLIKYWLSNYRNSANMLRKKTYMYMQTFVSLAALYADLWPIYPQPCQLIMSASKHLRVNLVPYLDTKYIWAHIYKISCQLLLCVLFYGPYISSLARYSLGLGLQQAVPEIPRGLYWQNNCFELGCVNSERGKAFPTVISHG